MMSSGRNIRTGVGLSNVGGEGAANAIGSVGEVEIVVPGRIVTKSGVIDEGSQIDGGSLSINSSISNSHDAITGLKLLTLFHLPTIRAPNKSAPSC
jgi:hypothetical protein